MSWHDVIVPRESPYREPAEIAEEIPMMPAPFWTKTKKVGAVILGTLFLIDGGIVMALWPSIGISQVGAGVAIHGAVLGFSCSSHPANGRSTYECDWADKSDLTERWAGDPCPRCKNEIIEVGVSPLAGTEETSE